MRISTAGLAGLASAAALLAGTATAQETPDAGGPVTLVYAGRLLDRPGQAPRGPSTLILRDGRIVEVRDGHVDPALFPGATVVGQGGPGGRPGRGERPVHQT
ncbi:MAG: hypothetical protein ACK5QD_08500 [Brevundimonas sp.]|uniref:hypothetical protein n=1 Tax=Brevundimonas sp. TaxID=1871086 RepID=UPI00391B0B89